MNLLLILFSILIIVFFVILSAFFSGVETAFVSSEYLKIKKLKVSRPKKYNYLNNLFLHPEHFLATTLVGNNICLISISSIATWLFIYLGFHNVSIWITLLLTPIIIIFAEMIPKSIGRSFKSRFIIYFFGMFKILDIILKPLVLFMEFVPFKVIALFLKKEEVGLDKDDIKILTEVLHSEGEIETLEKDAIEDVLGFSKDRTKDILVPMADVIKIDYKNGIDEVLKCAKDYEFTRYPVFKNKRVIGYLNIYDIFYKKFKQWQDLIRPITKVSINQKLDDVFLLLRERKENIALVLKKTKQYGIITTQDLMREITSSLAKG